MPPTETVGKLHVNRSSLRPSPLRQALFSSQSMSSDCSHRHTTANDLGALRTQTV